MWIWNTYLYDTFVLYNKLSLYYVYDQYKVQT